VHLFRPALVALHVDGYDLGDQARAALRERFTRYYSDDPDY
jgi:hypothetical protein